MLHPSSISYLEYNTGMELMKEVEEAQRRKMARLRAT